MKQLRKTGNPLDANTRNDINYNWDIINKVMADLSVSEQETVNQFLVVKGDIDRLSKKDAELMQMILSNTNLIEAMDLDLIKEQGDIAEQKGNTAKRQGDKAQAQGDKAEQQGDIAEQQGNEVVAIGAAVTKQGEYAKEQGDYAKEKAELAQDKITEITQAHNDLDALKVDAIKATQDANTQANNAKVEAENAKKQADYTQSIGDTVADKLDEIESVKQDVISKGETTQAQGLKAKEQGDYAQSVIDSYKHVGDWNGSIDYKKNQEVLFNGSTYRAIEDNKGTQPTDKSKWQLIAQRGVDGEGAVASVNGIMPDSDGNVNLGDIASKEYVDDKIGDVDLSALETKKDATAKLTEAKEYTDTQISAIPEVDLSPLETKEDAQAKLTEAKQYTDEKIGDVDLSALETKEDATAKLEEAKGYTDGEIAKVPSGIYLFPKGTELDVDAPLKTETHPDGIDLPKGWSYVDWSSLQGSNQTEWWSYLKENLPGHDGSFKGILTYNSWDQKQFRGRTEMKFINHDPQYNAIRIWDPSSKKWMMQFENVVRDIYQWNNTETSSGTTVFGRDNIAKGTYSLVWGMSNKVSSYKESKNLVLGEGNNVEGIQDSVIIGRSFQGRDVGYDNHKYEYLIGSELSSSGQQHTVTLGILNQGMQQQSLIVGNGAWSESSNALTLSKKGTLTIQGEYKTGGADYAEMFEWEDKNPENIDRVALAVTWGDGESIKLANSGDEIIGIVSSTAAILGDNPMDWDKRFVTDQFGRPLRKEYTEINDDGEEETYEWFVENPEYDKDAPYISRSDRPEWSAIGLMGKLYWIDDGTLEVGDYATVGSNGVATKGTKDNGWRVMKRISKNVDGSSGVVKVFFK